MTNFFDNFDDIGDTPQDAEYSVQGGVSNAAYLNDYRNRMPFHYIQNGTDGFYYWQYGSTMEIEIEIIDEVAFSSGEDTPVFPVEDIKIAGESVLDENRVATFGTMATKPANDYFTKVEVGILNELQNVVINQEITRADLQEKALNTKIDSEVSRALEVEEELRNTITLLVRFLGQVPELESAFNAFVLQTNTTLQDIYDKLNGEGWIPPQ